MFEDDYLLRLIKEMVRTVLKLVFSLEFKENQLYDFTQNPNDMEALKVALLFYSHLNQMDNEFLEDHDYSREEVVSGLKDVLERYHLDSMSALF